MIASTRQIADIFDVSSQTIANWHKRGCPRAAYGKWDVKAVFAWWVENFIQDGEGNDALQEAKKEYWQAKARNETVKADLAEGSVMPIGELKKAWAWRINEVSTGLGTIPLRLASLLVGKPEMEIRKILDDEIWKIRDNYARTGKFTPKVKMPKKKRAARKVKTKK